MIVAVLLSLFIVAGIRIIEMRQKSLADARELGELGDIRRWAIATTSPYITAAMQGKTCPVDPNQEITLFGRDFDSGSNNTHRVFPGTTPHVVGRYEVKATCNYNVPGSPQTMAIEIWARKPVGTGPWRKATRTLPILVPWSNQMWTTHP